jgi:hypothetical protein
MSAREIARSDFLTSRLCFDRLPAKITRPTFKK